MPLRWAHNKHLSMRLVKKKKKKKKKKVYSHNVLSVGEAKLLGAFSWRPTLPALFEFQLADSDPVAEL